MTIASRYLRLWIDRSPTLPERFAQADAACYGNVKALNAAAHRNAHKLVAMLPREAAHALSLRAHHPCYGTGQSCIVKFGLACFVRADNPDASLFKVA